MSTTASSSVPAAKAAAADVVSEKNEQYKIFFEEHLNLLARGKIVYLIPRETGTKIGAVQLREMAARLR
jgi:hypothetical protein